ncbi:PAS domain S-box protein [Pontibacter qinzhouensis]|uniref:histidine kinase n=1 Tax=Pontibacter qinzhouensis TaxID=2603253 RepID=A0A5C8KCN9_9BACT|nr:CHASE domain-containing protein [Pontibacter qinzhouensis]TXK51336.1 PAS domain S-box protein [Pontibacter qinzhouensis]
MNIARLAAFVKDYIIAIASFLFIFLITLIIYAESQSKIEDRNRKLFELKATQATAAIEVRMHDYLQILVGAKAFFMASDTVRRESWKQYYEGLNLEESYPGIQGLGFAAVVEADKLQQHIKKIRTEGYPEYTIWPTDPRNIYTSIIYLEPFTGRNLRAFGYDMFSEPIRRSAMQIARDTKQPGMTGKVRLVQETGEDDQDGFLIYLPVYKNNADPISIKARQQLIEGYIYSPFRVKDLMQRILNQHFRELDVEIYDGSTLSPENLLFSSDTTLYYQKKKERPFYWLSTLSIGNHTWRIYCTANPQFVQSTENNLPFFILFGGAVIGLLMFLIIWSLTVSRRSNRLKQTITDNATAALFIMDANGYCSFLNPAAEEMLGYTIEDFKKKPMHDLIHYKRPNGKLYPRQECPLNMVIQNNKSLRAHEDVFVRKDGVFVNVMCAARPITESGKPSLSIIEVRDITDEKRAQQAIIESEARFRTMADHAPVMIWVTDATGNCMYVNKQWLDFTGQSFDETMNIGWHQAIHAKDLPGFERSYKKAAEEASAYRTEFRLKRHDGKHRWVVSTGTPRLGADGEFLGHIGSILDITEIKEAQKKVRQNAELIQKLFLEVPALVGLVRAPDKQYVLANPSYKKLYGNRLLVGKTVEEAHPESEGLQIVERLEKVFRTGRPFIGNELPALIDRENNGELTEGYFNLVYQPLVNGKGSVEAVLMFAVEVTELVAARKKLLLTNDELSEKNTELLRINDDLDSFVYTASHDLKSPIANMEGLVTLLRDILQGKINEEDEQILDMVTSSIHKLKQTIADLAEITKVQKDLQASVEPLSFEDILQDVKSDIQNLVEESGVQIKTDFREKGLLYARKNLRSIVYNLVSNGIKYRASDRAPEVEISTFREGEYVVLRVTDNGLGIRKEQQQKLFAMFRRFHSHVEGTGIGLYIVKRIIENNAGRIEVASELGQGTTFTVYFKQEPVAVTTGAATQV